MPEVADLIEGIVKFHAARLLTKLPNSASLDFDDCLQEGRLAAWKAEKAFSHKKGAAINTFLTRCILNRYQAILQAAYRQKQLAFRAEDGILERVTDEGDAVRSTEIYIDFHFLRQRLSRDAQTVLDCLLNPARTKTQKVGRASIRKQTHLSANAFNRAFQEVRNSLYGYCDAQPRRG